MAVDKALVARAQLEGSWGSDCDRPGVRTIYTLSSSGVLTYQTVQHPNVTKVDAEITAIEDIGANRFRLQVKGIDWGSGPFTAEITYLLQNNERHVESVCVTHGEQKTITIDNGKIVATGRLVPPQRRCAPPATKI